MRQKGFTLIELSIVLVIIGLIIGGVLVGRDLISAAQNRATVAQIEQLNAAVNTFRLKYNCLPGDCTSASMLGINNWFYTGGDGNGAISTLIPVWTSHSLDYDDLSPGEEATYWCGTQSKESVLMWEELALAGLAVGPYATYVNVENNYSFDLPKSKNDAGGIVVAAWNGSHYFRIGLSGFGPFMGDRGIGAFRAGMSPADAAYFYTKMDGGTMTLDGDSRKNPTAIHLGERIIPVAGVDAPGPVDGTYDAFFIPTSRGAGGASADVCMNTSVTPNFFNVQNSKKICNLIIKAQF